MQPVVYFYNSSNSPQQSINVFAKVRTLALENKVCVRGLLVVRESRSRVETKIQKRNGPNMETGQIPEGGTLACTEISSCEISCRIQKGGPLL